MSKTGKSHLFSKSEIAASADFLGKQHFPMTTGLSQVLSTKDPAALVCYQVTASECVQAMLRHTGSQRLAKAARIAGSIADRVTSWIPESIFLGAEKKRIACKPGCNFCCSIRVNASCAEVVLIAGYIENIFTDAQRIRLREALERFVKGAEGLSAEERFAKPLLCPLNEDGMCTVYEVRPMLCRSYHSYNLSECRRSFERWKEDLSVTQNMCRKACGEAIAVALSDAISFVGLDSRAFELPEAIAILFNDDSLTDRISEGSNVLEKAFNAEMTEYGMRNRR